MVGAQALRLVGRRQRASGPARTCPTSSADKRARLRARPKAPKAEEALRGDEPFIMQADGRGWLFAPTGLIDGPFPTHYEPHESPFSNPLYGQQANPARDAVRRDRTTPTTRRRRAGRGRLPVRDDAPTGSPSTTRRAA